MKSITKTLVTLAFSAITAFPALATDPVRIEQRCEDDSLTIAMAIGRNDWSKKCEHISHRTWDYNMNDDYGKQRARPFYPSYYVPNDFDDWWRAPTKKTTACSRPAKFSAMIHCRASCYTPDQKLLFPEGELTIFDAFTRRVSKIVTLDDAASLDNLVYTTRPVDAYSESVRDVLHEILVVKTETGGELKVTPNHPLMVSTGHMRTADNMSVGDELIAEDGSFDSITSIESIEFYGKVYNVRPDSFGEEGVSLNGQIVVAQGYLSGSMYYQNTGANHVNRLILRDSLPEELL